MTDDTQQYSRAMFGGKCDDEISVRVPFDLRQRIQQLAHSYGMSESQFCRDLFTARAYGKEHVQSMQAAQLAGVLGSLQVGPANVPQTAGGAK